MFLKTLDTLDIANKKVLVRVDFNVPFTEQGDIADDTRILAALPTLLWILDHGGSAIIISHLGRPTRSQGQGFNKKYSLRPIAKHLQTLLKKPVIMAPDCIGEEVVELAKNLQPGQCLMLENLRFYDEEESPDSDEGFLFAQELCRLADAFVNDAFSVLHRSHTSIVTLPKLFKGHARAGFHLQKEIQMLNEVLIHPTPPFVVVLGGGKAESKISIVKALLPKLDGLMVGGVLSLALLKAQGYLVGDTELSSEVLKEAKELLEQIHQRKIELSLPLDFRVVETRALTEKITPYTTEVVSLKEGIPTGFTAVDIGPQTLLLFTESLKNVASVFWNGPMGIFEIPAFSKGTFSLAKAISILSITTYVGGGDTIAALKASDTWRQINHLSTGGGATLEYLEEGTLVGIKALQDSA